MERLKANLERQGISRLAIDSETLLKIENMEGVQMDNQSLFSKFFEYDP